MHWVNRISWRNYNNHSWQFCRITTVWYKFCPLIQKHIIEDQEKRSWIPDCPWLWTGSSHTLLALGHCLLVQVDKFITSWLAWVNNLIWVSERWKVIYSVWVRKSSCPRLPDRILLRLINNFEDSLWQYFSGLISGTSSTFSFRLYPC